MLSEHEEHTLNSIIETNIDDLMFGTVEDLKTKLETIGWLATKLKEINDKFKVKCPHGYEYGDHHWFKCMKVNPFEEVDNAN